MSLQNTKLHEWTTQFYNQNQVDLSGLVLLAAFLKPSGDPYMWCGALTELWSA